MNLLVGTSGFSYKEWKGTFYPEDVSPASMLSYYSKQLPSVEVNNTFYRLPKPDVLQNWSEQTPKDFKFVLKASRRITHFKRLLNAGDVMEYMYGLTETLGDKLGAILFQFPPNFRINIDRLRAFIPHIPTGTRAAFEFRHESWMDDTVFNELRNANCALCIADTSDDTRPEVVKTADWGYFRLRRPSYTESDLEDWARIISTKEWDDVFVFFKHEDDGAGPAMAGQFRSTVNSVIK